MSASTVLKPKIIRTTNGTLYRRNSWLFFPIKLTLDIIPHYRGRIAHATLPISGNYELDNGLVASVGFLCTLIREPVAGFEPATHGLKAIESIAVGFHVWKHFIRCST